MWHICDMTLFIYRNSEIYSLIVLEWEVQTRCLQGHAPSKTLGRSFSPLLSFQLAVGRSVAQSCLTLWGPTDWSLPVFSVRRIFPARTLEWVAISSSRGSSPLRNQTHGHLGSPLFTQAWCIPPYPCLTLTSCLGDEVQRENPGTRLPVSLSEKIGKAEGRKQRVREEKHYAQVWGQFPWEFEICHLVLNTFQCILEYTNNLDFIHQNSNFILTIIDYLYKKSVNYDPWTKTDLLLTLVNKILLEHSHAHLLIYCLWQLWCCDSRAE